MVGWPGSRFRCRNTHFGTMRPETCTSSESECGNRYPVQLEGALLNLWLCLAISWPFAWRTTTLAAVTIPVDYNGKPCRWAGATRKITVRAPQPAGQESVARGQA